MYPFSSFTESAVKKKISNRIMLYPTKLHRPMGAMEGKGSGGVGAKEHFTVLYCKFELFCLGSAFFSSRIPELGSSRSLMLYSF
jgi:hypothetical protein